MPKKHTKQTAKSFFTTKHFANIPGIRLEHEFAAQFMKFRIGQYTNFGAAVLVGYPKLSGNPS
jgi:hypothetical protein